MIRAEVGPAEGLCQPQGFRPERLLPPSQDKHLSFISLHPPIPRPPPPSPGPYPPPATPWQAKAGGSTDKALLASRPQAGDGVGGGGVFFLSTQS